VAPRCGAAREDRGPQHVEIEREAVLRRHDRDRVVTVDDEPRVDRRMDEAVRGSADGVVQRERVEREREAGAVGLTRRLERGRDLLGRERQRHGT
jgi:hypothetical protein